MPSYKGSVPTVRSPFSHIPNERVRTQQEEMGKMKKFIMITALALAACGSAGDKAGNEAAPAEADKAAAKGNYEIKPPVQYSADPAEKQKQQTQLVGYMVDDPQVPLDVLQGEAARRGVTLTAEQIARKKTQKPGDPRPQLEDNAAEAPANATQ